MNSNSILTDMNQVKNLSRELLRGNELEPHAICRDARENQIAQDHDQSMQLPGGDALSIMGADP